MAGRAVAASLGLYFVLSHSKPSFWQLRDIGHQRALIRERLRMLGGYSPDEIRYAARQFKGRPE